MISSYDLSTFTLHHDLNGLCNNNLCLIQDRMRTNELASNKFKRMCKDFPNMAILTKRTIPGKF